MIRQSTISDLASAQKLFAEKNAHNSGIAPDSVRKTDDVINRAELEGFIDDESTFFSGISERGKDR